MQVFMVCEIYYQNVQAQKIPLGVGLIACCFYLSKFGFLETNSFNLSASFKTSSVVGISSGFLARA